MDAYQCIVSKRDTRDFTDQPIADDLLRRVLNAGRMAGSAKNRQPIRMVVLTDTADEETAALRTAAADNLKRVIRREQADWNDAGCESPYWILDTLEVKTTWHPVGT